MWRSCAGFVVGGGVDGRVFEEVKTIVWGGQPFLGLGKKTVGGVIVYIPPFAKCWGHPSIGGWLRRTKQRQNTGVLRCAQDDDVFGVENRLRSG
jgi:hypothetical protein